MLDAGSSTQLPAAIVVGRTLATPATAGTSTPSPSYFVGEVQNNQETITYTVYNEQADPETGVLLTTTLEPGVTLLSSTVTLDGVTTNQLPDQSGQNLAWSLGTINGYDRESVAVTVSLANPIPLQLDTGAAAYATLDAGAVSATTPAAALQPGNVSDPSLLASTPDANTTDPFIQEEAAALNYDPNQIFSFLHTQIGYNSYLGSVRGAGDALVGRGKRARRRQPGRGVDARLGHPGAIRPGDVVARLCAELILSMFPASYQTVGYIPAGTQTADPANDPQLLAETESHYWFQFDAGQGFQDADPLMGAFVGETFTASQGTFTEVPDSLREKTEITLNAEIYSQANAAFGGSGLTTTTVLDQTFNDVDLVGRPITVGNFVSSNAQGGLAFTTVTNTYEPYIELSDEAFPDPSQDEVIHGQSYQEVLTNFPLGSQVLTGLFLNFSLTGPQGPPVSYSKTLIDRIGFANRQNGVTQTLQLPPIDPTGPPILSDLDLWTVNALPGLQSPEVVGGLNSTLSSLQGELNALQAVLSQIPSTGPQNAEQSEALDQAEELSREIALETNEDLGIVFALESDQALASLEAGYKTEGYYITPRLLVSSIYSDNSQSTFALDLLKDDTQDVPFPGQAADSSFDFEIVRGLLESTIEGQVGAELTGQTPVSITQIFDALPSQGSMVLITPVNLPQLSGLPLSSEAQARITQEVESGEYVLTPTTMVQVNGQTTVGWYEIDPSSGHMISVMEDGGNQEVEEYILVLQSIQFVHVFQEIGEFQGIANTTLSFLGDLIGGDDAESSVYSASFYQQEFIKSLKEAEDQAQKILKLLQSLLGAESGPSEVSEVIEKLVDQFIDGYKEGITEAIGWIEQEIFQDPSVQPVLFASPGLFAGLNQVASTLPLSSTTAFGPSTVSMTNSYIMVSDDLSAAWTSNILGTLDANTLESNQATVGSSNGQLIGSGAINLPRLILRFGGLFQNA